MAHRIRKKHFHLPVLRWMVKSKGICLFPSISQVLPGMERVFKNHHCAKLKKMMLLLKKENVSAARFQSQVPTTEKSLLTLHTTANKKMPENSQHLTIS